jgi:hypothetical protein
MSFDHTCNEACLWDPYHELWYRAACDAHADSLVVTLYADSACRKVAKQGRTKHFYLKTGFFSD